MRGLQDIRTLSGSVDQTQIRSRAYMKLGCLEMEKSRRATERDSATYRTQCIDERLREIEAEKAALLQAVDRSNGSHPVDTPGNKPKPAQRRTPTGGLRFTY